MDNTDPYKTKFKEERLYMSTNQNLMQHMRELIDRIKAADVAYYRDDNPTMTDREYDLLVEELKGLETTTGLILSGSPTQTVSGEILKELTPVRHTKPMLSADKTKSVDEMLRFANGRPVVLSWKLDGLTLVLRYEGGEFKQAITRGREGIIGEDVTHTVRTFMNVPMCIPCADKFEVRGEGVISWAHFEKINLSLSEPYSHPRNLAAGSVRMLDARESGKRYLEFYAFDLISDSVEEQSKTAQLQFLAENGFDVVPYVHTDTHDADELRKLIADFKPAEYGYPVDGVIMEYDNLVYGRSLGATGHHENRLMALKWEDELYETECTGLDVAVTRTGMVSLTATFKPVEIDGTMVSRAYVHNFTIYKNLALGVGDKLMVYKANKIIPQIAENRTKSGELDYPHTCPCCGSMLTFHTLPGGSKQLFCENPSCAAKLVQKFDHFCEKTRMNIEGLSATTLEKFIGHGWIKNFGDLYALEQHREDIIQTEGFGVKSYDRAFIRVGDRFIPVVNHGSSNCFDFDAHGREVPEKHWSVLNYTFHGRQLFTEEEIRQIAAVYEAANSDNRDGIRKSRNRSFGVGEFGRWIMNGMKTAHTVEEYRACGNTVVVVEYTEPIWKKHVVYTTEKLLDKLNDLDGNPISVSFWDDRTVTRPPTRRKNDLLNHNDLTEYYVLRAAQGFFVKRSSRRIWFARKIPPTAASVRKFGTEKAAQRYLDDNAKFFAEIAFQIEHIQNGGGTI